MNSTRQYASALGLTATLSIALAACGGGGSHGSSALVPPVGPLKAPTAGNATFQYGSDALNGSTYLGPAHFAAMGVNVAVRMSNSAGLVSYAQQASNPHSALYRQFLTPQDIGNRFGASTADYASVAAYFTSNGLHVGGWPQRLGLFVAGTQPQLERAFGTTFGTYRGSNGQTFIAPTTTPAFSRALPVTAVTHLVTRARVTPAFLPVRSSNSVIGGYSPAQIRNVFDYTGAYNAGYTGKNITVGIIGTGPFSAADLPAYSSAFHVAVAPVQQVVATDQGVANGQALNSPQPDPSASPPYNYPYSQGLQTPPPTTSLSCGQQQLPSCNPEDIETQIDTEQAASLAPGSTILYYIAYNPGECFEASPALATGTPCPAGVNAGNPAQPELGIALADDEIQQAIADNKVDVLSLSYGGPEYSDPAAQQYGAAGYYFDPNNPTQGFGPAEFAALAAEGIAVFVASGDLGAEGCKRGPDIYIDSTCSSYPATDPSVVSVGGVTTPMDQFGNLTNELSGWGVSTSGGTSGSGGGLSAYFPILPYQQGIPGAQGSKRNVPDLSLEGDNTTGVSVVANAAFGTRFIAAGGTSVAAPEMAAMWSLVLQACSQTTSCVSGRSGTHPYRLGNPNPLLYGFYYANGAPQPQYATTFYDVLFGNNAIVQGNTPQQGLPLDPGFNAGVGYDLITGLGVPYANHLIDAILASEKAS